MKNDKAVVQNESLVRILKIGQCDSISGKTQLTYHIGCTAEDIQFRIYRNSGSGYFSNEWITFASIAEVLSKTHIISSVHLVPLYVGRSANNWAFLLACLLAENLIAESTEIDRSFVSVEPAAFIAEMKALMDSDIALDPDAKPKKVVAIKKAGNGKKVTPESAPLAAETAP